MKYKKMLNSIKKLTFLLVIGCVLCSNDISAYAEEIEVETIVIEKAAVSDGLEYSVSGSNAVITGYQGSLAEVTIPDMLDGYKVVEIGAGAFEGNSAITSVTISDNVTTIGDSAFQDCSVLTSVKLSGNVSSIGRYAFWGCGGLTVEIPKSLTEVGVAYDGSKGWLGPFDGSLSKMSFGSGITTIVPRLFAGCSGLESVEIPDSVTSIGNEAFNWCTGLSSVKISEKCTSIGTNAFYNCIGLKEVQIPDRVTEIGDYAFYGCTNLENVKLSSTLTAIGSEAFWNCTSLYEMEIPKSLAEVGATYDGSKGWLGPFDGSLGKVSFGSGITTIVPRLFAGCSGLESVEIPDSVTSIGNEAFNWCTGLSSVKISEKCTSIGTNAFYNCIGLKEVQIPDRVTEIGDYVFYGCTNLENVKLSSTLTAIGSEAFWKCTSLNEVEIPKSLTEVGATYDGSKGWLGPFDGSLGKVSFGSGITAIVPRLFAGCSGLESVEIPDSVTSIGNEAFNWCTGLNSVKISEKCTSIGTSAFYHCIGLKEVQIPDRVTKIGDYAFYGCTNLENVKLSSMLAAIGRETFWNCPSLYEIEIPKSLTEVGKTYDASKGWLGPFKDGLVEVTFAKGISVIPDNLFAACTNLEKAVFPNTVTSVNKNVFGDYTYLTIYGYSGTCVETLAKENGATFVDMNAIVRQQVEGFVERMYTVALGREAEAGGLKYWTDELMAGNVTGAMVSNGFIMSEEFFSKGYTNQAYLEVLYRTFFDREPDEGGMNYWLSEFSQNRRSRKSVLASFIDSAEFEGICSSYGIERGTLDVSVHNISEGIYDFVKRTYTCALGREGDEAGIEYWVQRIVEKLNVPQDAARAFFLSPEYEGKNTSDEEYVKALYATFMNREADAAGLGYWVGQLNAGETRGNALDGFAWSPEFQGIMAEYGL